MACWVASASASTFRPLSLSHLVAQSESVVVATPITMSSHWANLGSTQRIVTDSVLQVDWTMRGPNSNGQTLMVRTLGGTIDGFSQLVYGEVKFEIGKTSLLFLARGVDRELHVLGMAQGHYPVKPDDKGEWRIAASPSLHGVLKLEKSAAHVLPGQRLSDIPELLSDAEATP
jgi:hypothetical protein